MGGHGSQKVPQNVRDVAREPGKLRGGVKGGKKGVPFRGNRKIRGRGKAPGANQKAKNDEGKIEGIQQDGGQIDAC